MRWIVPGEFLMGSPADEPERSDRESLHEVELTQGYWLADTACTQQLWQAVMGENPSRFSSEDNPVEQVSWLDVEKFLQKLNNGTADGDFRFPTEAQWEYSCRAGTATAFNIGENITPDQVNYDGRNPYNHGPVGEFRGESVPVKTFSPNDWGLYQMHGNVLEWCWDWFNKDYSAEQQVDPRGPSRGAHRVLRGGGWILRARDCRSAVRGAFEPAGRYDFVGFRFAQAGFRKSASAGQ